MALMLDRRNQIEEEEEEELWEDADTLCTVTIKSTQKPWTSKWCSCTAAFLITVICDFPIFVRVWLLAAFQAVQLLMSKMKDTNMSAKSKCWLD